MVGPKMQDFCPRISMLKEYFFQSCDELWFVKKCQNCTFKVNFGRQNIIEFFQKIFLSKHINLGDHYLLKTFFFKTQFLNHFTF